MLSFDIVQNLLKDNRSFNDNQRIYDWFKRKTDIFKNMEFDAVIEIMNASKIIEKRRNEIIIRQGDVGDRFYVMLKGSASVYVNTDMNVNQSDDSTESSNFKKLVKSAQLSRSDSSKLNKLYKDTLQTMKDSERKSLGEFVRKCNEGTSFGELALIQTECVRNASIISDENVYIVSITRDIFDHSLRICAESIYKEKESFVNNHFLFKSWMPRLKSQVVMSLEKETYCYDQRITEQGQESRGLLFLKKGEAKAIIDIKQHHNQFKLFITDQINEGVIKDQSSKENSENFSMENKHFQFKREVRKNINIDEYEVAILGENYIIGDIEFSFEMYDNLFTVIAAENCEVYLLGQANINRMINLKRNLTTFNIIQDLAVLKLNIYYNRCSIISDLPLLKYLIDQINKSNESENKIFNVKSSVKKVNFSPIFPPGPIIDLYGPGSVFFRNKSKRKAIEAKFAKRYQSKNFQDWKIRSNPANIEVINENTLKTNECTQNIRKSICGFSDKNEMATDWETSSEHLENLEKRLHNWMLNIPIQNKSYSDLSSKFTILKLPRFKSQIPSRNFQLIRTMDEKNATDGINTGKKTEISILNQKNQEQIDREYSILNYRRLKMEMHMKEKKLAIFRLTNVI